MLVSSVSSTRSRKLCQNWKSWQKHSISKHLCSRHATDNHWPSLYLSDLVYYQWLQHRKAECVCTQWHTLCWWSLQVAVCLAVDSCHLWQSTQLSTIIFYGSERVRHLYSSVNNHTPSISHIFFFLPLFSLLSWTLCIYTFMLQYNIPAYRRHYYQQKCMHKINECRLLTEKKKKENRNTDWSTHT